MDWFSAWKPGENWWFRWRRIFFDQHGPTTSYFPLPVRLRLRSQGVGLRLENLNPHHPIHQERPGICRLSYLQVLELTAGDQFILPDILENTGSNFSNFKFFWFIWFRVIVCSSWKDNARETHRPVRISDRNLCVCTACKWLKII